MSKKEKRKEVDTAGMGVCISGDRKIPATAATQLQDNAVRPFWSFKSNASAADDFFDCYVSFKELDCHEYVWDWRGRKLDEMLVKKLVSSYTEFFRDRPIGKRHFITYRMDSDIDVEQMGKLYMSIMTSNDFAAGQGMFSPPLFEVVHSTSSSDGLIRLANMYNECVGMATESLKHDCGPKHISVIPTHQFGSGWFSALNRYFGKFQSSFRCKVEGFRPVLPRSDLADSMGFVGAVIATKKALCNYAHFSRMTGIDSYPIVEAGPLLFRGGLSPSRFGNFVAAYCGMRTATITPSFRYDHELAEVKSAVEGLNRMLPRNRPFILTKEEQESMSALEKIFAANFVSASKMLPDMSVLADALGQLKRPVDPRLRRSFSLYSLGVPPEMIGTGRALLECIKQGRIKDLEHCYPDIKDDLVAAGALLNKENLNFLAKTHKGWNALLNDVKLIEDYTDTSLGPNSTDSFLHRNHTSNVFHLWSTKRDFVKDLLAAARSRRCMG